MKSKSVMTEGPEAFKRFKNTMKSVLSVSHEELQKRIEAERKKSEMKDVRPGPKRKPVKASASSRASRLAGKT
jgi:hypothetical protein